VRGRIYSSSSSATPAGCGPVPEFGSSHRPARRAILGGLTYGPRISLGLAANCGSLDSWKRRTRGDCNAEHATIRCTELTLIPTAFAIAEPVQWLAAGGGPASVMATSGDARRPRLNPAKAPPRHGPRNRSCQRPITGLALPIGCMISAMPQPSAVRRMIFAPQKCFCRAVAVRRHRFKHVAAGSAQSDVPSLVHSSDSRTRIRQAIPKRIEMSGVH
jgi:hypothetical protein